MIKARLEPGKRWDLGPGGRSRPGVMGYRACAGRGDPTIPYADWHGIL
ncbi:MAG: hypothetical protein R3E09_11255 [Novosphingobium sp.]